MRKQERTKSNEGVKCLVGEVRMITCEAIGRKMASIIGRPAIR